MNTLECCSAAMLWYDVVKLVESEPLPPRRRCDYELATLKHDWLADMAAV